MLYIVKEDTNEILWRCDAWDAECENKAEDWMTYNCYYVRREEITFNGDKVLWVKRF